MGRITTSVGLISGFPIEETVNKLIEVQSGLRNNLKTRTERLAKQQTAVTDIQTVLLSLQVAIKKLGEPKVYAQRSVTSSSTALSATATGTPPLGNFQFLPVRTATSHQLMSSKLASDTAPLGTGKFSFRFGGFVNQGVSLDLLNGGEGFQRGKIRVTDRSGASAEIDLSYARTVDDVLDAINSSSTVQVRAEAHGDRLRLVDETGLSTSNLRVVEVGGQTAASLGLAGIDVAANQADGADVVRLFSQLSLSTLNSGAGIRFDDVMADLRVSLRDGTALDIDFARLATPGTKATATTTGAFGLNSQVKFTAVQAGAASAGVAISFVDDPSVTVGNETVTYDATAKTLVFAIDSGETTANHVIAALARNATASAAFTATKPTGTNGTGLISLSDTGLSAGPKASGTTVAAEGTNARITFTAQLGGPEFDNVRVSFVDNPAVSAGSETVVFDDSDPENKQLVFQISDGNTTANDIIQALNTDPIARLKFSASPITGGDGTGLVSSIDSATTSGGALKEPVQARNESTLGDVLDTLNATAPTKFRAAISADGERIELTDLTSGNDTFAVSQLNASRAAADLGLIADSNGGTITGTRVLAGLRTSLVKNLDGGRGFDLGLLDLTDRSGATASVDLSTADTIDDVIDAINAAGIGIRARVNDARNGIQLTDTTGSTASNLIVSSGDANGSAELLGLTINAAVTSRNSGSLRLQVVNENTTLASLNGGAGVAAGTFNIVDSNGKSATISINSRIQTIGDLIDEINGRGLALQARINEAGDGIALVDTGGGAGTIKVTEGNRTTGADLHLVGSAKMVNVNGTPTQVLDGSTTITIDLDADDSLRDLVTRINAAGIKVTASIVNDGSSIKPFRFTLSSHISGQAGELLIDASEAGLSLSETSKAQDALLLYGASTASTNSILASSSSGNFRNLVDGLSLSVKEASTTVANVAVVSTSTDLVATVQASVDIINRLVGGIKQITTFDVEANTRGLLQGDSAVLRVQNEMASLLSGRFFGAGSIHSLQEIGVNLKDDGTVELDTEKLKTKLSEDPAALEQFLSTKDLGLAARLEKLTEQLAGDRNSLLSNRFDAFDRRITTNNAKIEFHNERLERQRELLLRQFQQMEIAIGKIQNSQSAIASLAALPPLQSRN